MNKKQAPHIKKQRHYVIIFLVLMGLCSACKQHEQLDNLIFTPCTPFPEPRAAAAVATCNDRAFVYGGRAQERTQIKGDLWQYNPEEDQWTQLGQPPLEARSGAVAITADSLIYIGLGFNGHAYNNDSYLRDWWVYNPQNDQWKRLQDYPSNETAAPSAFYYDGHIYVAFGSYDVSTNKLYQYTIATNQWKTVDAGSCSNLVETVATTLNGRSFAGTNRYWYEFNHTTGKWERKSGYMKGGNWLSSALIQHNGQIYLMGGREWTATASKSEIIQYDIEQDTWSLVGHLPQEAGKENAIAFTLHGVAYYGLGEEMGNTTNKLYRISFH